MCASSSSKNSSISRDRISLSTAQASGSNRRQLRLDAVLAAGAFTCADEVAILTHLLFYINHFMFLLCIQPLAYSQ